MRFRILVVTTALVGLAGFSVARAADGAAVYKAQCAKCHGDTGLADSPAGKAMKATAIKGDAKIAAMADADLVAKIKENKKHAPLKSLSADDLAAAATFAKGRPAGKYPLATPQPPPTSNRAGGAGRSSLFSGSREGARRWCVQAGWTLSQDRSERAHAMRPYVVGSCS